VLAVGTEAVVVVVFVVVAVSYLASLSVGVASWCGAVDKCLAVLSYLLYDNDDCTSSMEQMHGQY